MATLVVPGREEAIRILQEGQDEVRATLDRLRPADRLPIGIGGGRWSPKDLVGHLSSWEEHGLVALDAWERGERAPIDQAGGVNEVNAATLAAKAPLSWASVVRDADDAHAEIIARVLALTDEEWTTAPVPRTRRSLGRRLGGILGGPAGLFRHVEAHLPDLRAFVDG